MPLSIRHWFWKKIEWRAWRLHQRFGNERMLDLSDHAAWHLGLITVERTRHHG